MGKRNKDDVPNVHAVAQRDIFQRMNFLYQASVYLNSLSSDYASAVSAGSGQDTHIRKKRMGQSSTTTDISRSYIKSMKIIGKKTVAKMCVYLQSVGESVRAK